MKIHIHKKDIPANIKFVQSVAVDTETMGLDPKRDRLCVVQLSSVDGECHIVQIPDEGLNSPNLKSLFVNKNITKIFHYARFDMAILHQAFNINVHPIYCTKIASKIARTYTDKHGLKELCKELLSIDISKAQQCSDWGLENLSKEQINYAANDVLHLHKLKEKLDKMLIRENRINLANDCFNFLPKRVELDLAGWINSDIFAH